ncbi:MAG: hypothetical protein IT437_11215 [Phycisphaerales bacterium]|nr:hypothetical protein [Phycisphaerales bacterium]
MYRSVPLARLRELRNRTRDLTLAADLDRLRDGIKGRSRAGAAGSGAWNSAAPAELRAVGTPAGVLRGVLTIRTPDAASRFLVDRWLRTGGEAEIIRAATTGIRRVRVVLAS